jgi:hypothetical protein
MQTPRGRGRIIPYSSLTSALYGDEWSATRPGRAVSPVPIVQETGWASELIWTQRLQEKFFAPVGDRTSIVQVVVRHYTDWATPALKFMRTITFYSSKIWNSRDYMPPVSLFLPLSTDSLNICTRHVKAERYKILQPTIRIYHMRFSQFCIIHWPCYKFHRDSAKSEIILEITAFWDIAPCSLVELRRRFRDAYSLHM